jgi:hypothetical protein
MHLEAFLLFAHNHTNGLYSDSVSTSVSMKAVICFPAEPLQPFVLYCRLFLSALGMIFGPSIAGIGLTAVAQSV